MLRTPKIEQRYISSPELGNVKTNSVAVTFPCPVYNFFPIYRFALHLFARSHETGKTQRTKEWQKQTLSVRLSGGSSFGHLWASF